jgi:hypothetical protein
MRRREKFVLASVALAVALMAVQSVPLEWRPLGLLFFALMAYVLAAWSFFDNLDGVEWFTIVPLPALYALSVSAFYFLLPDSILARVIILGLFGLGMYALFLAGNIFTIAKVRTIQLLRAAQAVLFFFCLIAALLAFNTILSFGLLFIWNGLLSMVVAMLLSFSFYWCIRLEKRISHEVISLTVRTGMAIGFLAVVLSFLPGALWPNSLVLMSAMYTMLGLGQSALEERLFTNTIREYVAVFFGIMVMYFVMLPWR